MGFKWFFISAAHDWQFIIERSQSYLNPLHCFEVSRNLLLQVTRLPFNLGTR